MYIHTYNRTASGTCGPSGAAARAPAESKLRHIKIAPGPGGNPCDPNEKAAPTCSYPQLLLELTIYLSIYA